MTRQTDARRLVLFLREAAVEANRRVYGDSGLWTEALAAYNAGVNACFWGGGDGVELYAIRVYIGRMEPRHVHNVDSQLEYSGLLVISYTFEVMNWLNNNNYVINGEAEENFVGEKISMIVAQLANVNMKAALDATRILAEVDSLEWPILLTMAQDGKPWQQAVEAARMLTEKVDS